VDVKYEPLKLFWEGKKEQVEDLNMPSLGHTPVADLF